jgi:hypothetical protein
MLWRLSPSGRVHGRPNLVIEQDEAERLAGWYVAEQHPSRSIFYRLAVALNASEAADH